MMCKYVECIEENIGGDFLYCVGICDDAENICSYIETIILEYARANNIKLETEIWYSGESLCNYLENSRQPDILFLDIELFSMNGIDAADFIRNKLDNRQMQIIYISGKDTYAKQLFKTQPMDFLVKPISDKDIKTSLDTAIKLLNKTNGKFRFQYGKDFYYIPFSEIMYFCSDKRKIIIQTLKSELCFYGKLCDIKDSLPTYFIPIHQSYIVNQNFIIHYTYDLITLANDEMLSISRRYQKEVRTKLINEDMN